MRKSLTLFALLAAFALVTVSACSKNDDGGSSGGCTEGDQKVINCNTCQCVDGSWACTGRGCVGDIGTLDSGDGGPGCRVGATKMQGCNTCTCTENGWQCTQQACVDTSVQDSTSDTEGPDPDTMMTKMDTGTSTMDALPDGACMVGNTVNVSGNLAVHEATAIFDSNADIGGTSIWFQMSLALVAGRTDRSQGLDGPNCVPALETVPTSNSSKMANLSSTTVEISSSNTLVGITDDDPSTGSDEFIPTASILATPPLSSSIAGETAFAISSPTEKRLSFLAAGITGSGINGNAGELVKKGFLMIRFHDQSGNGVSGVVVTDGSGSRVTDAIYPNKQFNNATGGSSGMTADHGIAFIPGASNTIYSGKKGGMTFKQLQIGSASGLASVAEIEGQ